MRHCRREQCPTAAHTPPLKAIHVRYTATAQRFTAAATHIGPAAAANTRMQKPSRRPFAPVAPRHPRCTTGHMSRRPALAIYLGIDVNAVPAFAVPVAVVQLLVSWAVVTVQYRAFEREPVLPFCEVLALHFPRHTGHGVSALTPHATAVDGEVLLPPMGAHIRLMPRRQSNGHSHLSMPRPSTTHHGRIGNRPLRRRECRCRVRRHAMRSAAPPSVSDHGNNVAQAVKHDWVRGVAIPDTLLHIEVASVSVSTSG